MRIWIRGVLQSQDVGDCVAAGLFSCEPFGAAQGAVDEGVAVGGGVAKFQALADGGENGMIVTHGGLEGGYGLYLKDGRPTFVYNFLSIDRPTFTAKDPLPKGQHRLTVSFAYDGGGMGKGGTITMSSDGKTIAEGRMERSIPIQFSLGEGLDVGMDIGSPIDFTYDLPFAFTGKIEKVTIGLEA